MEAGSDARFRKLGRKMRNEGKSNADECAKGHGHDGVMSFLYADLMWNME
jgi:hypothetical protein